jgi:hypothetical protein
MAESDLTFIEAMIEVLNGKIVSNDYFTWYRYKYIKDKGILEFDSEPNRLGSSIMFCNDALIKAKWRVMADGCE